MGGPARPSCLWPTANVSRSGYGLGLDSVSTSSHNHSSILTKGNPWFCLRVNNDETSRKTSRVLLSVPDQSKLGQGRGRQAEAGSDHLLGLLASSVIGLVSVSGLRPSTSTSPSSITS